MRFAIRLFLLVCITAAVALGCDSSNPEPVDAPSAVAPFSAGTVLQYRYTYVEEPIGEQGADTLQAQDVVVEVVAMDASLNSLDRAPADVPLTGLVEVDAYNSSAPQERATVWYVQSPDSLVEVAYRKAGAVPIATATKSDGLLAGSILLSSPRLVRAHLSQNALTRQTEEDRIEFRNDPRLVYRAPLEDGASWTSFREPFLQTRTVVGSERVFVPAGTFETTVIETTSPIFGSLLWRTRIAPTGLIEQVVRDTVDVRGPGGETQGQAVATERVRLTSVSSGS